MRTTLVIVLKDVTINQMNNHTNTHNTNHHPYICSAVKNENNKEN